MPATPESNAVRKRLGKWSSAGVPHKGWTCIETDDLGSNMQTCEMCETSEIRYAHTMTHPKYRGQLVVGVICAGNMEQDVAGAKERERHVKNRSSRRLRWPQTKWKTSRNGNQHRNHAGYKCVVKQWPQGWQLMILPLPNGEWISGKKRYPTATAAKLAGFDYIERNPRTFNN
jgi:hypothetical protein